MGDLWLLPFVLSDPFILRAKVDGTKIVQKSNPKCGFRLMSNMLLKHHRIPSMSQRIKCTNIPPEVTTRIIQASVRTFGIYISNLLRIPTLLLLSSRVQVQIPGTFT